MGTNEHAMIRPKLTEPEAEHLLRALDQVVRSGGIDAAEMLGPIATKLRVAYAAAKAGQSEAAQREAIAEAIKAEKAKEQA
jgi:hypothetical protein